MSVAQRKRQRKLAKRAKKAKAKKKLIARQKSMGLAAQLKEASKYPILDCFVDSSLWIAGIGNFLISRSLPHNKVAVGTYLIDPYCLGIKDAFGFVASHGEYTNIRKEIIEKSMNGIEKMKPADALKLVEDSVAYAKSLGLSPHKDYLKVKHIFGDIDANESTKEYEFGKDGKPFFVNGPHESIQRCRQIISILMNSVGEDGFDYFIGSPDSSLFDFAADFPGGKFLSAEEIWDSEEEQSEYDYAEDTRPQRLL